MILPYTIRMLLKPIMTVVLSLTLIADLNCAQGNKATIAVLDFEPIGVDQITARTLTERFRTVTVEIGAYTVISRGDMDQILEEQKFQLSGCASDECIVEVGKLLGAQYMLGASLGRVGDTFTIDMRIIDVESGEITRSTSYNMSGKIDKLLTEGLAEVASIIFKPAIAFVRITSNPEKANIILSGNQIGRTPQDIEGIYADSVYSIHVGLGGFEEIDTTFIPVEGENPGINFKLKREMAPLSVYGFPAGVPISANKDTIGFLPLNEISLPTGKYNLLIKQPGYKMFRQTIQLEANQPKVVQAELIPKSRMKATTYSAVLPGVGQFYAENYRRGSGFLVGTIAALYLCYTSYDEFGVEKKLLDTFHDEYMQAPDYATVEIAKSNYLGQLDKVQGLQNEINLYSGIITVSWTMSIADAYFWSGLPR
jgi:TolB-like protein